MLFVSACMLPDAGVTVRQSFECKMNFVFRTFGPAVPVG